MKPNRKKKRARSKKSIKPEASTSSDFQPWNPSDLQPWEPDPAAKLKTSVGGIKLLGYRKAGRCDLCGRRHGSKGRAVIVRLAVPDRYHGVAGVSICFECVGEWALALKVADLRAPGKDPLT